MRILHILRGLELTSGISAFLVENADRQVEAGHDVAILYERFLEYRPSRHVKIFNAKSPCGINFTPDIVHIHAVWSLFSVKAMRWCLRNKIPFIVSPHGCLMPRVMTKGRVKKCLFYRFLLKPLIQRAAALHATAQAEAIVLKNLGLNPKIYIVPLGVELPQIEPHVEHGVKKVLFVGRLGEEKGLVNLLHAWSRVDHVGWRLVIAGPDWMGYKRVLEEEVGKMSLQDSVDFPGVVSGDVKDQCYRSADVFVLPSPMENFSSVVLEAMAYSLPVIATKGTPWKVLSDAHCGWWIDQGLDPLVAALNDAMHISDSRRKEMGERGKKLAEKGYSWDGVSQRLLSVYSEILRTS